jgi:SAM-dependent methyltransferase
MRFARRIQIDIDSRLEAAAHREPDYAGWTVDNDRLGKKTYRTFVGGLWEEMGRRQLDFLKARGLRPEHKFLDVGCGSLRAGHLLVDYLEPGNYYGIDINRSLIETGYKHELTEEQRARLPVANLRETDRFDAAFGVTFDMAIAQSVFTHMSLNNGRLCLQRIAKLTDPGARFFVTFFEGEDSRPIDGIHGKAFTERNPYWYYRDDMRWMAERTPWAFEYIGAWGHPRGQRMVQYTRTPGESYLPLPGRPLLGRRD